jgi:hypothetical protein
LRTDPLIAPCERLESIEGIGDVVVSVGRQSTWTLVRFKVRKAIADCSPRHDAPVVGEHRIVPHRHAADGLHPANTYTRN